tara:strand:+ start:525 stop:722 length:198 start_codon:yes stop_codon:yes gene_type:complete
MRKRPTTDIEPELLALARKMKALEIENDRVGKMIDIALETFEVIWETTHDRRIQIAQKKMMKLQR